MTEMRELAAASAPGDLLEIKGYVDTKGAVSDFTVVLLEHDDYRRMQTTSLARLERYCEANKGADSLEPALRMTESLHGNLYGPPKATFKDVYRDAGGFHVHKDAGTLDEIYILRSAVVGALSFDTPKTPDATAKQNVSRICQLPNVRYRHSLKFAENKFSSVRLVKASALSPRLQEDVREAVGRTETIETSADVSEPAASPA